MWACKGHTEHCLQEKVDEAFKSCTQLCSKDQLLDSIQNFCVYESSLSKGAWERKKIFFSSKDLIQHYSLSLLIKKTYSIELCCYLLGRSFLKYSIKILYYSFFTYFIHFCITLDMVSTTFYLLRIQCRTSFTLNLLGCINETASYKRNYNNNCHRSWWYEKSLTNEAEPSLQLRVMHLLKKKECSILYFCKTNHRCYLM